MSNQHRVFAAFSVAIITGVLLLTPSLAHASIETSLDGIRYKLTGTILPLLSVIGIALAAISFFSGNPQSKQHIVYAIIGCALGFGAQSIVDMIQSTVR